MTTDKYRIFHCNATKFGEYKIPSNEIEKALETLKNEIRIDYTRTLGNGYWYVGGRYDK